MNLRIFKEYFVMVVGMIINAFGWVAFLIPHKIVGGGINGLGVMINYSTGFSVGLFYLIVNIILVIIAIKQLGAHFGIKTIFGIITLSILLLVMEPLFPKPLVDDAFMATLIGGVLGGLGLGMVLSQGGSTGGTDIISVILAKYTHLALGKLSFYLNVVIIASSYLLFQSMEIIIYGLVTMAASSYAMDHFLEGNRESSQMFIISEEYEKIADRITKEMGRGVTLFRGKGWYTQSERNVMLVIVRKKEVPKVMNFIKGIDKKSFISVNTVRSVYGQGFENIEM